MLGGKGGVGKTSSAASLAGQWPAAPAAARRPALKPPPPPLPVQALQLPVHPRRPPPARPDARTLPAPAVKFASAGEATLVVSTDPAHSLSDAFDQDLRGGLPVAITSPMGEGRGAGRPGPRGTGVRCGAHAAARAGAGSRRAPAEQLPTCCTL
jgi:hypothetical protein